MAFVRAELIVVVQVVERAASDSHLVRGHSEEVVHVTAQEANTEAAR